MAWTDDDVQRLRELWDEGRSASQIAAILGGDKTRNAIIGKAHRLGLAARPSPPQKWGKYRKAPLSDMVGTNPCVWPLGNPSDPDFRLCGKPALGGRPYCAEHCQRASFGPP